MKQFKYKAEKSLSIRLTNVLKWIVRKKPRVFKDVLPRYFCSYGKVHIVDRATHEFGGIWKVYSKYCCGCGHTLPDHAGNLKGINCALLKAPMLIISDKEIKPGDKITI